jgi:hypothetical protein
MSAKSVKQPMKNRLVSSLKREIGQRGYLRTLVSTKKLAATPWISQPAKTRHTSATSASQPQSPSDLSAQKNSHTSATATVTAQNCL